MTAPDWLTPAFPELRERPPWVMQEMVAAEPLLARPLAAVEGAEAAAAQILEAVDAGRPVVVTGCGTSEHAAQAVAAQLEEALEAVGRPAGRVRARQAFDAAHDPQRGGVCLAVSHEAATAATAEAIGAAKAGGARTVLVTACPDAPGAQGLDLVLATPLRDRSWCHTVGYLSPIVVGGAVAAALRRRDVDAGALEAHLHEADSLRIAALEIARRLEGARHLIAIGSGVDEITARELTLKVEEGVHLPSATRHLETFLHGHLPACDDATALVAHVLDGRARRDRAVRTRAALAAAARVGVHSALVATADVHALIPDALVPAGRAVVPAAPRLPSSLAALTAGALALQHLTLALALAAGTNPDLIRREEAPYREAAALAAGDA